MKALLLNGPPGSGKDTIGKMIWSRVAGSTLEKFAKPIVDFMLSAYGVNMAFVAKDEPHPALNGRTPRQVAIRYSEGFCKPLWGRNYFGDAAVARLKSLEAQGQKLAIFTDSGFLDEALPVLDHLGHGNVLQVRITRAGYNYQHDSRSTWSHPSIGYLEIDNDCESVTKLADKVLADLTYEVVRWLPQ